MDALKRLLAALTNAHDAVFGSIERALDGWFVGTAARFALAAVIFGYYWNSALTKIGDGLFGVFTITDDAWAQILPAQMEAAGYDSSQIATIPWGVLVTAGTYGEFLLPFLIVIGLFTRLAAFGMIGFVIVQSWVDIAFHGADEATVGALFDRLPGSAILDQRTLWIVLLALLVAKGAGPISLDTVLRRRRGHAATRTPAA